MSESKAWMALAGMMAVVCLYLAIKPERSGKPGTEHPAIGARLAELQLQPLTGNSESVSLNDLSGKVVLLNFWGTWCPPCVMEFPHIVHLNAEFADRKDFRLLAVSSNGDSDDELGDLRAATAAFLQANKTDLPTYADQYATTRRSLMRVANLTDFAFPTTVILDRNANIRGIWVGFSNSGIGEMESLIDKLLSETNRPVDGAEAERAGRE